MAAYQRLTGRLPIPGMARCSLRECLLGEDAVVSSEDLEVLARLAGQNPTRKRLATTGRGLGMVCPSAPRPFRKHVEGVEKGLDVARETQSDEYGDGPVKAF